MFGFIRPVKAELRVKEADRFQQVYCGLCHAIRAEYGRFYTLFLSYDMTFFALVAGSEEAETAPPCRKRCDASPFRRKSCAETDDALRLAADASILLTYHKFQDDLADEKGAKRALAALLCRLGRRGYEKARARMPEADEDIRQALEDLRRLEAERCPSMDRAADTSSRMFYQIGRWIYLVDAVQDIQKDMEENSYNPVVLRYELQTPDISAVREPLERTLERSLADICMAFDLLSPRRDADLIRNIIFLGMPTVTRQVLNGTYQTNEGRGKHGSL